MLTEEHKLTALLEMDHLAPFYKKFLSLEHIYPKRFQIRDCGPSSHLVEGMAEGFCSHSM